MSRSNGSRPPRVALLLDNPQRDLAGIVLVAIELCQRGYECFLVPASLREREVWALAPNYVLLYHFRRGWEGFVQRLTRAGIGFGVADNEGAVWERPESYAELLMPDATLRETARPVCMWGSRLADYVSKNGWYRPDQIAVTGCPRFDFHHPRWQSAVTGSTTGIPPGPTRILVNTNYTEANPRFTPVEGVIRELCETWGWARERALSLIDQQKQTLQGTLDLIADLARRFPGVAVVVRPHPFESTDVYRERLAGYGNIEFNLEGSALSAILRAAAVIQITSTTAVETALAGVPALLPTWIPTPLSMPLVRTVSDPCADFDDLASKVEEIVGGRYEIPPERQAAIDAVGRDWFGGIDGLAHQRLAQALLPVLRDTAGPDQVLCRRYLNGLDGPRRSAVGTLARHLRSAIGLSPSWSFRRMRAVPDEGWTKTDRAFGRADVAAHVQRLLDIHQRAGRRLDRIRVELARDGGDYSLGYLGHAVAMKRVASGSVV